MQITRYCRTLLLLVLASVFTGGVVAFQATCLRALSQQQSLLSPGPRAGPTDNLCSRNQARPHSRTMLEMALDQSVVEKYIAQASDSSSPKVSNKLAKALKKVSGAIAIGLEYRFDKIRAPQSIGKSLMPNNLETESKGDLRAFSMQVRKEKASALFVDGGSDQGEPKSAPSLSTRACVDDPYSRELTARLAYILSRRARGPRGVRPRAGDCKGRIPGAAACRALRARRLRPVPNPGAARRRRRCREHTVTLTYSAPQYLYPLSPVQWMVTAWQPEQGLMPPSPAPFAASSELDRSAILQKPPRTQLMRRGHTPNP